MKRIGLTLLILLVGVIPSYSQSVCFLPSACGVTLWNGGTITNPIVSPGATFTAPVLLPDGTAGAPSLGFASDADGTGTGIFRPAANIIDFTSNGIASIRLNSSGMWPLANGKNLGISGSGTWNSLVLGNVGSTEVTLFSDAANTLALRNGGTTGTPVPQTFNLYNFCDGAACATGYERGSINWSANVFELASVAAGTGTVRPIRIVSTAGIYFGGTFFPTSTDSAAVGSSSLLFQSAYLSRSIQGSKSTSLTDAGAAVSIWRIAVATNSYAGGKLIFTANSTDGTDRLTTTGEVTFAGADTAGTVTCGIGTPYGLVTAYRRVNTLLCTFTAVTSTTNCDIQVTCTDNLAGAQTMAIESRLDMPKPNTVTPQ